MILEGARWTANGFVSKMAIMNKPDPDRISALKRRMLMKKWKKQQAEEGDS